MTARAARWLVRLRHLVVLAWIGGAIAAVQLLPTISDAQLGALGDLVPADAEAIEAERRSFELFGFPLLSRTIVVQRDPGGLSTAAQARTVARAVDVNRGLDPRFPALRGALPVTNAVGEPPAVRERSTTALTYLFFDEDTGQREQRRLGGRYIDLRMNAPGDAPIGVTGAVPARASQSEVVGDALERVELATLAVVLLIVGLHFRSLVAPLVNVAGVAIAYLISVRVVAALGRAAGVSVPSEVEPVIVVLLFGIVSDYTIFHLSRFRRLLAEGVPRREAAERATADLLPIILAAGLTIVLASASLVVAELGFLRAFGPGMAVAVLVGLLVAISWVPATMALLGAAMFAPSRARPRAGDPPPEPDHGARNRAVRLAVRHPVVTALACTAALMGAASGVLRTELGYPLIRGLPESAEARVAYEEATRGFAPGVLAPTAIVVEGERMTGRRDELASLQAVLAAQPGVALVLGPADQPVDTPAGAALSRTGDAARYLVVMEDDPLSSTAIRRITNLDERLPGLLGAVGLERAEASVAGDTALVGETIRKTREDVWRVAPLVLLAVFGVTAVLLRALVAPLYLLLTSVLALAASLGLATYLFQDLLGYGELDYFVPVAAGVLLLALGSDYNVFLVGRIWQEARRRPLREAIAVGGARAATPIAVAGVVLAASFALSALVPTRAFYELAFVMAAGLLIDAFVVRALLVPALMTLVGSVSAWPGRGASQQAADALTPAVPARSPPPPRG